MSESAGAGDLTRFAEDVWLATEPVRMLGMRLTATMTVVRLADFRLLVHSPTALTPERRTRIESLGTVAHLYAPNTFHHLWLGDWASAFPDACVHGPAALRKKRPDLRLDRAHDVDCLTGDLGELLDEVHIGGFALEESVLVHRPSRTAIVADLVHNVGRPTHRWTAFYAKAMGFYDRVAISRMIRWTAFPDSAATRESLERLASCSFERLIVGHGPPLEHDARDGLFRAYDWLERRRRLQLPAASGSRRGYCG